MRFPVWCVVTWVFMAAWAAACVAPPGAAAAMADLAARINDERAAQGLPGYRAAAGLDRAAQAQACDMARHGYFAHERPGGPRLGARIKAAGYRFQAAKENLAYSSQVSAHRVMTIWLESPPHRAAILDSGLRDMGLALAEADGRVYWVMVVAR